MAREIFILRAFAWTPASLERILSLYLPKISKAFAPGASGEEKADGEQNLEHSLTLLNFPGGKEALAQLVTNIPAQW